MSGEKIAVIGLGYVGLPLAVSFARKHDVVGFDISRDRIKALKAGVDATNEVAADHLKHASLSFTADAADLRGRDIFIVTVPTPIDDANRPDFGAMLNACQLVGSVIAKGAIVVFESTVYPGVTEEVCAPALEQASGMQSGVDFMLGYSPERINPGDKQHPLEKIIKVVAGQNEATLKRLSALYGSIIEAGIHEAPSIKVAEAAKVLENTQRDVNIALMNEVSKICDLLGIRSKEVLSAAGTKWNFLKFHPGLVGGHCIGVDPYYLTAKAEELGYHPEVILSGRRVNDGMGAYVGQKIAKNLGHLDLPLNRMRVGILGFTFKENVPDIRNSKVIDIYRELQSFGMAPVVHDPMACAENVGEEYQIKLSPIEQFFDLHALVLAVPHQMYDNLKVDAFNSMLAKDGLLVDVKSVLDPKGLRSDIRYWSL